MPRPYPVLPRLYAEAVERYLARDVGGCKALLVRFLEDFHDDGPARCWLGRVGRVSACVAIRVCACKCICICGCVCASGIAVVTFGGVLVPYFI